MTRVNYILTIRTFGLSDLSGPFEEIIATVLLGTVTSNNFRICIEDQRESGKSVKMRKHSYL